MEVIPFLLQYQCLVEGCTEKFKTSKDRKDHLVRRHLYPADFRFDKPKKSRGYVCPPLSSEELSECIDFKEETP